VTALFDIAALTADMPEARVMRGENYFAHGWASLVDQGPDGLVAHVMGERGIAYVVDLASLDGTGARCTCPDFQDSGLRCKHVVAAALQANAADPETLKDVASRLPRLRDILDMEGRDDPDGLVALARRDPDLLRSLEG